MFVVAAGDYAVGFVAEGDGEDSGGVGAVEDWSVENLPGLAPVGGMEDASGAASGGEPDVGIRNGDAGIAGGECALAFDCVWEFCWRDWGPGLAVVGDEEFEFQFGGFFSVSFPLSSGMGSPRTMPCVRSQKTMESKKPLGFVLVNWSRQCWPASVV